jgi:hypothetical protein
MLYVRSSISTKSGRAPVCDDDVARLYARGRQGKPDRIGAARNAHAVLRIAKSREFPLEFLQHRAAYKACGTQRLLKNRNQLSLELLVRAGEIQERNFSVSIHWGIFDSSVT